MKSSENIDKLATAMCAFQGDMQDPSRDGKNPRLKNKYVSLQQALHVARPQLSRHGLSIVQLPDSEGDRVGVATRLMHSSGQWLEGSAYLPLWEAPGGVNVAQIMGMAISYLRRYSILSVAGFAHDDDDAESVAIKVSSQVPERAPNTTQEAANVAPQPMPKDSPERAAVHKYLTTEYARGIGAERLTGGQVDKVCKAQVGKAWSQLTETDGVTLVQKLAELALNAEKGSP